MTPIEQTEEWKNLQRIAAGDRLELRDLFARDPDRADKYTFTVGDLIVDLSKNLITSEVVQALVTLANRAGLAGRIEAMFAGERINVTEDRAVMHPALRAQAADELRVDGEDVVAAVHRVLDEMAHFAERVRSGEWTGHTGKRIRSVVNIGIGGSDLGPAMAYRALRAYADPNLTGDFVSNVDPADLASVLARVDPETTLFIVSSKSFSTLETLSNARQARQWLVNRLGDESAVASHFVAVSTNIDEVTAFGIDPENMFQFWDWVGGRYSMDSAIGLSLMILIGPEAFREMLSGFRIVDQHFRSASVDQNVPALMGLVGVWYRNMLGYDTQAVLPYAEDLSRFPAYLQQLDMESNGKRTRLDGTPVAYDTGPIVWGEPGTNGQHAFYQLLHQGTTVVPADLIGFANPTDDLDHLHDLLTGNMIAQAEALAFGKTAEEVTADGVTSELVPHRTFPGNRPTTVILAPKLTPSVLGQLIALYEHKIFTQGTIWQINSFDQWGVELGKVLATRIIEEVTSDEEPELDHDVSTNALIKRYRQSRRRA